MLIAASLVLGLTTSLWLIPILAGPIGEVAHFASSAAYRWQLRNVQGARTAAVLSAVTLSVLCVAAFWIGLGVRAAIG